MAQTLAKQSPTNTNRLSANWHVRSRLQSATLPCSYASRSFSPTHQHYHTVSYDHTPLQADPAATHAAYWDFPPFSFCHLLLYCAQARFKLIDIGTHSCLVYYEKKNISRLLFFITSSNPNLLFRPLPNLPTITRESERFYSRLSSDFSV